MGYITAIRDAATDEHNAFQSSFELMGYITRLRLLSFLLDLMLFQSSFELMGYITAP